MTNTQLVEVSLALITLFTLIVRNLSVETTQPGGNLRISYRPAKA